MPGKILTALLISDNDFPQLADIGPVSHTMPGDFPLHRYRLDTFVEAVGRGEVKNRNLKGVTTREIYKSRMSNFQMKYCDSYQLYKNPGDGARRQRDKRTLAEQIQARAVSQLVSSGGKNLVNHLTQKKVENRALAWARYWGKSLPSAVSLHDYVEQGGQELVHSLQQSEVKTKAARESAFTWSFQKVSKL